MSGGPALSCFRQRDRPNRERTQAVGAKFALELSDIIRDQRVQCGDVLRQLRREVLERGHLRFGRRRRRRLQLTGEIEISELRTAEPGPETRFRLFHLATHLVEVLA